MSGLSIPFVYKLRQKESNLRICGDEPGKSGDERFCSGVQVIVKYRIFAFEKHI